MNKHLLFLALCGLLLLRCDFAPVAGGSTDTELGRIVTGMVYDEQGRPASHARVDLIPQRYNPVIDAPLPGNFTDTTDSMGRYNFSDIPKGAYALLAAHQISNSKLLITGIDIGDKDKEVVRPDTLRQTGSIAIEFSGPIDSVNGYVYIPGTTFFGRVAKHLVIDGIPSGRIPAACYTNRTDTTKNYVIDTSVNVIAGRTVSITDYHAWGYSKRIFLNTSSTGADVKNDVTGFPVLVRLTGATFNFSQAKGQGEDLRFTKPDGSPLPYEIERWDLAGERAEIWVSVDTVRGNDTTQYLVMLWGNSRAADNSNGAMVFDTGAGFQGVWHLNESGGAITKDATFNHFDGTPSDTAPQQVEGVIGSALQFDGISNGLVMKNTGKSSLNFPRSGTYTFSAWVSVDSVYTTGDEMIAGKGFDQYALRIKTSSSVPSGLFALHEYVGAPIYGTEVRWTPVVVRQWKYMVGIRDAARSFLFIDGQCVDSTGTNINGGSSPADTTNFSIGRCGTSFVSATNPNDYLPFRGKIDEVRIASVHFSADWIKLSYMNQKSVDMLIQFAK